MKKSTVSPGNTAQRKTKTRTALFIASPLCGGRSRKSQVGSEPVAVSILAHTPAGSKSFGASAGLLTRSSFCAFPAAGPVTSCRTFVLLAGAGTHSNGYCRRFSLRSLFIPLRLRRSGKPLRTQRYVLKPKNQEPAHGFLIFVSESGALPLGGDIAVEGQRLRSSCFSSIVCIC